MIFIAIIVSLLLELFLSGLQQRRPLYWFVRYFDWLGERLGGSLRFNGPLGVFAVLALPVLVVGILQAELRGVWFGLLELVFTIAVLTYSLRYQPLDRRLDEFVDASESGNEQGALDAAEAILGNKPSSAAAGAGDLTDSVLVQANERLFAVLFWFVFLGPVGAALYRLSCALTLAAGRRVPEADEAGEGQGLAEAALRLQGILDWLPTRLLAFSYALVGSFEDALQQWRKVWEAAPANFVEAGYAVLRQAGTGALRQDRNAAAEAAEVPVLEPGAVKAARGLILRSLILWVSAVAVVTLVGWTH